MLAPFLNSLAGDDQFHFSTRDWHRLNVVLRTPGAAANLEQLRAILRSVLVCSDHEWRAFDRRFNDFFPCNTRSTEPLDVRAALGDLQTLLAMPIDNDRQDDRDLQGTLPSVRPPAMDVVEAPLDIETVETLPRIELIDERPLLFTMPDEQLREWRDQLPPAEADPRAPTYFSLGLVCRQRLPMLSDDQLTQAADSLGFFRSDVFSSRLDVRRSIAATLESGGLPIPWFENRRQLLSLVLLVDQAARDLDWNTVPQELALGLRRRGVSVAIYTFHGIPDRFTDERGRSVEIDDLEEIRRQLIVLLITDGHGMYRRRDRRPLERMSRWPRVALLDPRPSGLGDLLPRMARDYRLALFPCDGSGMIQCLRYFTSEEGRAVDPTGGRGEIGVQQQIVRGQYDDDESFLGEFLAPPQLAFAQACALPPSISLGLSDRLRRMFFPDVWPSAIGELLAILGTRLDCSGISFAAHVRDALLRGFQRQDRLRQQQVFSFLEQQIRDAANSLVHEGQPGLAALQARFQVELMRALIPGEQVETSTLLAIWKKPELACNADLQVDAVLRQIQSDEMRRLADSRLQPASQLPLPAVTPENLARIPAGEFWMGDPSTQGDDDERPRHRVHVSEFFLEKQPVTWSLWEQVYGWALAHGYTFGADAAGTGEKHPVHSVSWHDAVAWCNARSEMESLHACYYQDAEQQQLHRGAELDLSNSHVAWDADGYRLPTEAEWEKAARGGLDGQHFPWASPADQPYEQLISKTLASYERKGTSPVGQFAANEFGLFDMAGNVWEWCWDLWVSGWYANPDAEMAETHGPTGPTPRRVYRGGCCASRAWYLRCASRSQGWDRLGNVGFRVARGRLAPVGKPRSERSSPRIARLTFIGGAPEQAGAVTLKAVGVATSSRTVPFKETVELEAGSWEATFTAPHLESTNNTLEALAFYHRSYDVRLRPQTPNNLARIPAGEFWMGDPSTQVDRNERPRHRVYVSEFFLEKEPVTWSRWQRVIGWALAHGYTFGAKAAGSGEKHPVQWVSWHDAVAWCNARSELESLHACYYQDAEHHQLYRGGELDLPISHVAWNADGYRLPTEAEWEKAARGGLEGQHFPWESPADQPYETLISVNRANFGGKLRGTSAVGNFRPTESGCSTWRATFGNGAGMFGTRIGTPIQTPKLRTRLTHPQKRRTACPAAVAGFPPQGTCAARTATGSPLGIATSRSASVLHEVD